MIRTGSSGKTVTETYQRCKIIETKDDFSQSHLIWIFIAKKISKNAIYKHFRTMGLRYRPSSGFTVGLGFSKFGLWSGLQKFGLFYSVFLRINYILQPVRKEQIQKSRDNLFQCGNLYHVLDAWQGLPLALSQFIVQTLMISVSIISRHILQPGIEGP